MLAVFVMLSNAVFHRFWAFDLVGVNYLDRSATTILAGGSGE
jgi:hypothetical protein